MRVTTSKSKNSESFYITHSYINKNGKSTSKIFKKLGTLIELSEKLNTDRDGVMAWAKEQAKIETDKYNKENALVKIPFSPTSVIQKNEERLFNAGYLFLQSICSDLRFDNISRNIKSRHDMSFNLEAILSDLVYARILNPSSKRATYSYAKTFLEPPKYDQRDIYEALSILAEESDYIQAEVYRNSNFIKKRNTKVLYYDCTNYFFEIEQDDALRKYGKSKENRPNPIVGMGLFMDADGIPLAFDIHPGNQNEQTTLKPLEEKIIRDFNCDEFVFCSDAGLGSQSNKALNNVGNRAYVITKSIKALKKEDKELALETTGYRKVGGKNRLDISKLDESNEKVFNSVYYKEIPIVGSKVEETLFITYSPKYKHYQETIRTGQISRAEKMITSGNKIKKTRKNPNDPARFIKKTSITESGEVATDEFNIIDQSIIDKEAQYDGLYGVSTNLEDDISEIIKINERRWEIEECFRIMKTEFSARPVYLQREDRIKAHFLTCFLALLVYRLLEYKLEDKYTVEETISTLRGMNMTLLDGFGYIPSYKRTNLTDDLHNTFDFRTDYEIITKAKMRSIIKNTK